MTSRKTTMDPPVHLALPAADPKPVSGCDVCTALDRQRAAALERGDGARATDCSVEIRQHPHRGTR